MDTIDTFCKNVRALRLRQGLKVIALSEMSQVAKNNIWKIESNVWKNGSDQVIGPSLKTVEKLANAFEISVPALLTNDMTMKSQGADYITNKYLSLNHLDRLKVHKLLDVLF